jgi:hypothetical protein
MSGSVGDNVFRASGVIAAAAAGRTGTVDWQTDSIKTATFTAVTAEGYFCNTAGGAFEMDLPAGVAGSIVSVQDYNNTFDTYALTVDPNGSELINGGAAGEPVILDTEAQGVTFVYIDGTVGWRSVQDNLYAAKGASYMVATGGATPAGATCGNCKIHTFTGPGTFCVSAIASDAPNNVVSYTVVAGGGGGGRRCRSGGGGAGGFREYKSPVTPYTASSLDGNPGGTAITVSASPYAIVAGGGGTVVAPAPCAANKGSPSSFSTVTSTGGGQGGSGAPEKCGAPGGSGGGGAIAGGTGGTGNDPPVAPAQGTNGGSGPPSEAGGAPGQGGGGATVAGTNDPSPGVGGAGATTSISGCATAYAGGGGGGGCTGCYYAGGTGGGGAGGKNPSTVATAGLANTGGGGGGNGPSPSEVATGGSGVVIIRYKFQ